jgi:choline dehydrogenase-like flavoprotein
MLAFGEMLPRMENRVMIDSRLKDAWGIPCLRVDVTFGDNDLAIWRRQKQTLKAICQAIGGRRVMNAKAVLFNFFERKPRVPGSGFHESGGARMGEDPTQSVVGPYNQLWDAPNVFVVDSAVFPTVGFQNSTLTEVALAFRASEHILSEARTGNANFSSTTAG